MCIKITHRNIHWDLYMHLVMQDVQVINIGFFFFSDILLLSTLDLLFFISVKNFSNLNSMLHVSMHPRTGKRYRSINIGLYLLVCLISKSSFTNIQQTQKISCFTTIGNKHRVFTDKYQKISPMEQDSYYYKHNTII